MKKMPPPESKYYLLGSNLFCVPFALAAILDISVNSVIELLDKELGSQSISGIYYPLALKILKQQGYNFKEVKQMTSPKASYFLIFHGHVGVVMNSFYYDNINPDGLIIIPRLRAIETIFEVDNRK